MQNGVRQEKKKDRGADIFLQEMPSWTSEIITDETIQYQTPKSSLPTGGLRGGNHIILVISLYVLQEACMSGEKKCLAALFTPY